jgi:hypothetical protein
MSFTGRCGEAQVILLAVVAIAVVTAGGCAPEPARLVAPTASDSPTADRMTPAETAAGGPAEPESEVIPTPSPPGSATSITVSSDHQALLEDVLYDQVSSEEVQAILKQIGDSGDTRYVAGLIDTLRFRRRLSEDIGQALVTLTGQNLPADWFEWVEWAGKHPEIETFADYPAWKAKLYSNIDPNFLRFLYPGVKVAPDSRVEEIVWGGVRVDGIPALDYPTMIDTAQAGYLVPHERVFGVSINGDVRAYPARFLDWHEMFNDVVGGEPVSLAY